MVFGIFLYRSSTLLLFSLLPLSYCLAPFRASFPLPIRDSDGVPPTLEIDQHRAEDAVSVQGWTPQPNGRGTIDIIWSCIFTIFLCSWSALCLNVPAQNDPWWKPLWRKFSLTCLAILGPEFILQIALGQFISAFRSVRQFRLHGRPQWPTWTWKHAFFADMGGFVLHAEDFAPFPVDAKQIHYLLSHDYISFPSISEEEIEDRNKVDALLRAITILQTLWFVLNCVARWVQDLEVTTFELTTLGFIFCSLGTHVCWAHKPLDVEVSEALQCKTKISHILNNATEAPNRAYSNTPLEFISRKEYSWSLWWSFMFNIVRKMHIHLHPRARPMPRFPNDNWLELPPGPAHALGLVDMLYAAIYIAGWNIWCPTSIERVLWRASTATIMCIVVSYLLIDTYAYHLHPILPQRYRNMFKQQTKTPSRTRTWLSNTTPNRIHRAAKWLRNNSPNQDPELYMPLKASIPITITGFIYGFARAYIVAECFAALRELPSSAYKTVNWWNFLPHV